MHTQVLGWLLDACTTEVFSTTLPQRLRFLADWPLASLAAHWLAGCAFMALAALLVTELRRVLHPDVLRCVLQFIGQWR